MLYRFYKSIVEKIDFKIEDDTYWHSAIGYRFDIPTVEETKTLKQNLQYKTVMTASKKLKTELPKVLYPERVSYMY